MTTEPMLATHPSPAPAPVARKKRPEIDFFRGSMLMLMVIYHNFRVGVSQDPIQLAMMSFLELCSTVFLLVSGVNVANFIASAAKTPDFQPTRFYLKASVWLFLMGFSYNFLVRTWFNMDILQCVAMGTLLTYLLLHYKIPNYLVGLVTLAIFAAGVIGFGSTVQLYPSVKSHFLFNQLIANGQVLDKGIDGLSPAPWLFNLFGPIPWVGFFTLGIFVDRLQGKWIWIVAAIMVGIGVAGAFLPPLDAVGRTAFGFRANPRYILQAASLSSIWFLLYKAYYRNKAACNRTIAFWSESSLIVFVFHWIFIMGASALVAFLAVATKLKFFQTGFTYSRAILAFGAMALLLRPLDNWRRRLAAHPRFVQRARTAMIVGFLLTLFGLAKATRMPGFAVVAYLGTVLAACTFAFSYPSFRAKWRKEAIKKSNPA